MTRTEFLEREYADYVDYLDAVFDLLRNPEAYDRDEYSDVVRQTTDALHRRLHQFIQDWDLSPTLGTDLPPDRATRHPSLDLAVQHKPKPSPANDVYLRWGNS